MRTTTVANAVLILALFAGAGCSRPRPAPPVILISIDTLRSDHLRLYGYRKTTTPAIDALGADSILFENAWSHVPLTLPSHLSILTGLLPPVHGVRDNAGYRFDAAAHPTLATILRANGYRTGAAISAWVLRGSTGMSSGFDDYEDGIGIVDGAPLGMLQRPGDVTERVAERWIDAHQTKPFFFFLHLYEPHTPYAPTYDKDIEAADRIVGRFLQHLRDRNLYHRSVIVLLSDHGEGLMEHGEEEHGIFLYREALQVPLLLKVPGSAPRRVHEPAGLIDLLPTLLDVLHIVPPAPLPGRAWLSAHPSGGSSYAESLYPRIHYGWSELRSLVRGPLQLIEAPVPELYDLVADRGEHRNLAVSKRRETGALRRELSAIDLTFPAPAVVGGEEKKKLAALGYLTGGSIGDAGTLSDPKARIGDVALLREAAALTENDPARAIERLTGLLARNPGWSDVRDELASLIDEAGHPLDAARIYEDGIRLTPTLASQFALSAGWALFRGGRIDEAIAHAGLAAAGGNTGAHLLLGEIALSRRDSEAAAAEAALAEHDSSERSHARFLAARVAAARGDYPAALRLLESEEVARGETGASLPRHFHYVRGDALAHTGHMRDAMAEMRSESGASPDNLNAYADLGLMLFLAGDRPGAERALETMARRNPRRDVYSFAARCAERWGDPAAAATWRERSRASEAWHGRVGQ